MWLKIKTLYYHYAIKQVYGPWILPPLSTFTWFKKIVKFQTFIHFFLPYHLNFIFFFTLSPLYCTLTYHFHYSAFHLSFFQPKMGWINFSLVSYFPCECVQKLSPYVSLQYVSTKTNTISAMHRRNIIVLESVFNF